MLAALALADTPVKVTCQVVQADRRACSVLPQVVGQVVGLTGQEVSLVMSLEHQ